MDIQIPPVSDIQTLLVDLSHAQMQRLSVVAKIPFTTLWKIRTGETGNPGIQTVGLFLPHIAGVKAESTQDA